jgi:hypothetical protein
VTVRAIVTVRACTETCIIIVESVEVTHEIRIKFFM